VTAAAVALPYQFDTSDVWRTIIKGVFAFLLVFARFGALLRLPVEQTGTKVIRL
jgi:hypothetical protein